MNIVVDAKCSSLRNNHQCPSAGSSSLPSASAAPDGDMSAPPPDAAGVDAASAELEALGIGVVVRPP